MDLNDLRLFVAVADRLSFAAVARTTGRDPSAVSRAVAALEVRLGQRLFQRSTRRMSLTEEGRRFLEDVAPHVAGLERAEAAAQSAGKGPQGTLRLTCSTAFGQVCIVPRLAAMRRALPGLSLELIQTDAVVDLVGEGIDLAFRLAPAPEGDLVSARLMTTRYRVVASPGYLASAPRLEKPADLAAHRCLLMTLAPFRSRWRWRPAGDDGEGAAVQVAGDITLSSPLALRHAAEDGLGPALLADWLVAEALAARRLIDVFPGQDWAATSFDTAVWALYPSRRHLPARVRAALDFWRGALRHPAAGQAVL